MTALLKKGESDSDGQSVVLSALIGAGKYSLGSGTRQYGTCSTVRAVRHDRPSTVRAVQYGRFSTSTVQ